MGSNRCIKFMTHMKTGRFTFSCSHNLLFQCHLIEFAGNKGGPCMIMASCMRKNGICCITEYFSAISAKILLPVFFVKSIFHKMKRSTVRTTGYSRFNIFWICCIQSYFVACQFINEGLNEFEFYWF